MSATDTSAGAAADEETRRDEILDDLRLARRELSRKLDEGRVRDAENERVRVKQARALAYVANVELDAIEAEYLEELQEDLNEIKASQP